ncbi:Methyl-accepting chemotaxis protein [Burkholderia sp. OK233]|nr:Methyl-accepting chemotaxis protein [Burkholderia sp. OK233]
MKLATKLWISTALLLVLIFGIVGLSMRRFASMEAQRDTSLKMLSGKVTAAYAWSKLADIAALRTQAMIISADPALSDVFSKDNAATISQIAVVQKTIAVLAHTPADRKQLDAIAGLRNQVLATRDRIAAMRSNEARKPAALAMLNEKYMPVQTAYGKAIRTFVELQEQQLATAQADFERQRYIIVATTAILIVVLALSVLTGAAALIRSISKPLLEVNHLAAKIAQGDLSADLTVTRVDEFGELMESILAMSRSLACIVQRIRAGAESIGTASSQIASGNLDLSQRTEQQAASLEETAASMEQLTGTVRQNTDNARQAGMLAVSAAGTAERGNEVVSRVVATMAEISQRSERIGDIIAIIEGIAFQTNILALNAAVEAARAGEQGRGFAVVAGEVRTLAQRSSSAAKEIRDLIETSAERVRAGSLLVGEAGQRMNEIDTSVRRVTDIMGEIAAASAEQQTGIEQVALAVTQMDEVTQQNAALVEEAAAAAQSLEEQGRDLKATVALFRLSDYKRLSGNA